jgi:Icc-related predicted phosphoesterase
MISICGDIHGFIELLVDYSKIAKEAGCSAMIQAGDFGVSPQAINDLKAKSLYPHIPVFVIAGNHEYFNMWDGFEEMKEVMHNVFFVQPGVILKLDEKNVLFLGKASSIDKKYQGKSWDYREDLSEADKARVEKYLGALEERGEKVDVMISHVPPERIIRANFDNRAKLAFGVGIEWQDNNSVYIEEIWDRVGNPPLYAGHMHRKVIDGNCRILDINEMIFYPPAQLLSAEEANAQMSSVQNSRIIPPFDEPKEWEHPMSYNHPLDKPKAK